MKTRRILNAEDLYDFQHYCESQGWEAQPPIGNLETLRLTRPRSADIIIGPPITPGPMTRSQVRYALYDEGTRVFNEWQESRNSTHSVQKEAA